MAWQLQEAKQQFSEVVRRALEEGPQTVTRHGEEVVVIVPIDEWRRRQSSAKDFNDFLTGPGPSFDDLDLERRPWVDRPVDL